MENKIIEKWELDQLIKIIKNELLLLLQRRFHFLDYHFKIIDIQLIDKENIIAKINESGKILDATIYNYYNFCDEKTYEMAVIFYFMTNK